MKRLRSTTVITLPMVFRCIRLANIVVYVVFLIVYLSTGAGTCYRERAGWSDVLAVMTFYSWLLLLPFCLVFLFIDRQTALRGFAILVGGILVGFVTPRF